MSFHCDCSKNRDHALLLLRLVIAAIFINHGLMKMGSLSAPVDGVMNVIMKVLAIVEPLAGIALIIGMWTEVAATVLAVIMIGALYVKLSGGSSLGKVEFEALLLVASLLLSTTGPGKFAVKK
jgi:uncharacterized membrane protein YphA (DoxX/SURF4 family)